MLAMGMATINADLAHERFRAAYDAFEELLPGAGVMIDYRLRNVNLFIWGVVADE